MKNSEEKLFYKNLIHLVIPIAMQSIVSTSLNIVDTLMVGKLQEQALAAVGLANQFFYFFILIVFGISSGSAIFTAQFWGDKNNQGIKKVLGLTLLSCIGVSAVFTMLSLAFPKEIMRIFIKDVGVIESGSSYLRIVSVSYIITSCSFAYSASFRSIGETKTIMRISVVSLICNTVLNYILIFGKFGFPMLGVKGAAIATVISRVVELSLIIVFTYRHNTPLAATAKELFYVPKEFCKKFYGVVLPVIVNEGLWSLGITIYSIAYGRMGATAVAAIQICSTVQNLFMIVAKSLSTSAAVMIGNKIGEQDKGAIVRYTKKFCILGIISGIIMGIIMAISAPYFVRCFNIQPGAKAETIKTLYVISAYLCIKVFNVIMIVGFFRSGGTTHYACILDAGTVWAIGIPMAFIGALVLKWPLHLVVALISLEEVVKACIGLPKIMSWSWIRNVVK
ncbi:MAG: MATE family efflux transporter [Cellulosilyticaceae bacterium]